MAKKDKRQKASAHAARQPGDYEREVREALDDGRGRKALGLLKEARKAMVEVDDSLTVESYTVRLSEMLDRGQHEEAALLFNQVLKPMPAWLECTSVQDRLEWMLKLGFEDEWCLYGKDPERDAAMEAVVLERLRDPRLLAHHPALHDDHALKQQAGAIVDAWTLIDSERFAEARERLGAVGRRSPLRGWRVLLRGLIAYYEAEDELLNELAGRMPENAAARPLFDTLTALLRSEGEASPRVKRLRERAAGNELKTELAELDRLMDGENVSIKRILAKTNPLLSNLLNNGRQALAIEIAGFLFLELDTEVPCMGAYLPMVILHAFYTPTPSPVRHRVLNNAFNFCSEENKLNLSRIEEAVLLAELARDWLDILDALIEDLGGYEECFACEDAPEPGPEMNWVLEDECPGCILRTGIKICRRSLQLHPLEDAYRTAVEFMERNPNPAEAPLWIDAWRKAFPDSVEPLQYAIKLYSKAGLYEKAREVMEELRQRRGTATMSETDRLNILTEHALSLCKGGKNVLVSVNKSWSPPKKNRVGAGAFRHYPLESQCYARR
ncbi:MAG: hypothetical protein ACOCUY_01215 [Verrucomicrobiota bacterium]